MYFKLVLLLFLSFNDDIYATLVLEYSSVFPLHANTTFYITLSAMKEYKIMSLIRIEILMESDVLSKTIIHPGFSDQMENKILNEYFWIENWYKDTSGRMNLLIRLLEAANNKWLCLSFQEALDIAAKYAALKIPCTKIALLHSLIKLTVDPILDFSITTKDGRIDGVHHNDDALIECTSRKGVPSFAPLLSHPSSLIVKSRHFNKDTNTAMLYFLASIRDHGKIVTCTAGRTSVSATIHVFHNPRTIYLRPSYSTYVSNGTSIVCVASDGFPKPTIYWKFIKGPEKASTYYTISPSYNLTMLPHTPIGSSWTFNCSAINSITKSYDSGVSRTFTFIIYPLNQATTIILAVGICGGVVLLILIVILCNRRSIHKKIEAFINSRSGTTKENGDDTLNNLSSSYFTYPTVPDSAVEPELELETKKPRRKSRRNKAKCDSDIYEDDNIV